MELVVPCRRPASGWEQNNWVDGTCRFWGVHVAKTLPEETYRLPPHRQLDRHRSASAVAGRCYIHTCSAPGKSKGHFPGKPSEAGPVPAKQAGGAGLWAVPSFIHRGWEWLLPRGAVTRVSLQMQSACEGRAGRCVRTGRCSFNLGEPGTPRTSAPGVGAWVSDLAAF